MLSKMTKTTSSLASCSQQRSRNKEIRELFATNFAENSSEWGSIALAQTPCMGLQCMEENVGRKDKGFLVLEQQAHL